MKTANFRGASTTFVSSRFPFWDNLLSLFDALFLPSFALLCVWIALSLPLPSLQHTTRTQHSTTTTWIGTRTATQPLCTVKHTTAATENNNKGQQPGCRRPGADESGLRAPAQHRPLPPPAAATKQLQCEQHQHARIHNTNVHEATRASVGGMHAAHTAAAAASCSHWMQQST